MLETLELRRQIPSAALARPGSLASGWRVPRWLTRAQWARRHRWRDACASRSQWIDAARLAGTLSPPYGTSLAVNEHRNATLPRLVLDGALGHPRPGHT